MNLLENISVSCILGGKSLKKKILKLKKKKNIVGCIVWNFIIGMTYSLREIVLKSQG